MAKREVDRMTTSRKIIYFQIRAIADGETRRSF
jgi:hypothetical protein